MLAPRAKPIQNDSFSSSMADEGPATAWRAGVDLAYEARSGQTIPTVRRHFGPLRVLKGYRQSGADCWEQVLVHPPGGIAGSDQLDIRVFASKAAQVLMTTPGASKWYRRAERIAEPVPTEPHAGALQTVSIRVTAGSGFEWLPLENIFYDGAVARLDTHFEVAPDAALIAGDVFCLGRPASNAPFEVGCIGMHTRVTRNNRPLFIERTKLTGGSRAFGSPAGLNGHPCFGSLIVVPEQAKDQKDQDNPEGILSELCDRVRKALGEQVIQGEVAVTALPQVVLVRWRGPSAEAGWHALRTAWQIVRKPILGREAQEPRIWAC